MQEYNKIRKDVYTAVGAMSGTSLDGLDMVLCRFEKTSSNNGHSCSRQPAEDLGLTGGSQDDCKLQSGDTELWKYTILKAGTLSYSGTEWPQMLLDAETAGGFKLMELHRDFGRFTGESVNDFLKDPGMPPASQVSLIASHGHTVFHRPEKNITLQIGDGAEIAAKTGITTVSDFRRFDVALGGQGAPLVPAGDELLFGRYQYCLNLGGFANISFRESGKRLAFDICPVNIVMNRLAREKGVEFDRGGQLAASGSVDPDLLNKLESLEFYNLNGPRSLGKEWVDEVFMPVLECSRAGVADKLRTVCEHIALRIAAVTKDYRKELKTSASSNQTDPAGAGSLLITGGGAKNDFLTGLVAEKVSPVSMVIPDEELVDYKEAIIFAFLGLLRLRNEVNCLASVTGASRDNCGGIIHLA